MGTYFVDEVVGVLGNGIQVKDSESIFSLVYTYKLFDSISEFSSYLIYVHKSVSKVITMLVFERIIHTDTLHAFEYFRIKRTRTRIF